MDPNHKYMYLQQKDYPSEYSEEHCVPLGENHKHSKCQFQVDEPVEVQLRFDLGNLGDSGVLLESHGSRESHWEFVPQHQVGFSASHEVVVNENQDVRKSFDSCEGWLGYSYQEDNQLFIDPHVDVTKITDAFEDKEENIIGARSMPIRSYNYQDEPNAWMDYSTHVCAEPKTPINHNVYISKENEVLMTSNSRTGDDPTTHENEHNGSLYVEEGLVSKTDLNESQTILHFHTGQEGSNALADNGRQHYVGHGTPIVKEKTGVIEPKFPFADNPTNHKDEDNECIHAEQCLATKVDLNGSRSNHMLSHDNQALSNAWVDNGGPVFVELETPMNHRVYCGREKVGVAQSSSSVADDSTNHKDEDSENLYTEERLVKKLDLNGAGSSSMISLNHEEEPDTKMDDSDLEELKIPIDYNSHIKKRKEVSLELNSCLLANPNHKDENSQSLNTRPVMRDAINKSLGFCKKETDSTSAERVFKVSVSNHGNVSNAGADVDVSSQMNADCDDVWTRKKIESSRPVRFNIFDDSINCRNKENSHSLLQIDNLDRLEAGPGFKELVANEENHNLADNVNKDFCIIMKDVKIDEKCISKIECFSKEFEVDDHLRVSYREKVVAQDWNTLEIIKSNEATSLMIDAADISSEQRLQGVCVLEEDSYPNEPGKDIARIKYFGATEIDHKKQHCLHFCADSDPNAVKKLISLEHCVEAVESNCMKQVFLQSCDGRVSSVVEPIPIPSSQCDCSLEVEIVLPLNVQLHMDSDRQGKHESGTQGLLVDEAREKEVHLETITSTSSKHPVYELVERSFSSNSSHSQTGPSEHDLLDAKVNGQDHVKEDLRVADIKSKTHEFPDCPLDVIDTGVNLNSVLIKEKIVKCVENSLPAISNREEVEAYDKEHIYAGHSKGNDGKCKADESSDSSVDDCGKDAIHHSGPITKQRFNVDVSAEKIENHCKVQKQGTPIVDSSVVYGLVSTQGGSKEDTNVFCGAHTKNTQDECAKIKDVMLEIPANGEYNAELVSMTNISTSKVEEGSQEEITVEFHKVLNSDQTRKNGCKERPAKTSSEKTGIEFVAEKVSTSQEAHDGLSPVLNSFSSNGVQTSSFPVSGHGDKSFISLTMKPFNEQQQLQLRAQIMVYGALIQGAVPQEEQMVTAFANTSGALNQGEKKSEGCERTIWEKLWRESFKRTYSKGSFTSSRISHKSNAVAVISSPKSSKKASLSFSGTPNAKIKKYAANSVVATKKIETNPDSRPRKRRRIESASPGTNLEIVICASHDNHTGPNVCSSMLDAASSASITPPYQPQELEASLEKSIVASQGDKTRPTSGTIGNACRNEGIVNKIENLSCELELARKNAEQSLWLADHATRDTESMWIEMMSQNVSDLSKDAEVQVVSSLIAMKMYATIARAAAVAAQAADEAAFYANIKREKAIRLIKQVNKDQTLSLVPNIDQKENLEDTLVLEGRPQNFESLVRAAKLTADAISGIGAVMEMGESPPFTLKMLMDGGVQGFEKLMSASLLKQMQKTPTTMLIVETSSTIQDNSSVPLSHSGNNHCMQNMEVDTCRPFDEGEIAAASQNGIGGKSGTGIATTSQQEIDTTSQEEVANTSQKEIAITNQNEIAATSHKEIAATSQKNIATTSQIALNSIVEVLSDEEGLRGVWFSAKVLQLERDQVLVLYDELLLDNGREPLEEWIPLETLPGKAPRVRLAHPCLCGSQVGTKRTREAIVSYKWAAGDRVDAWIRDGWWEGEITEIFEDGESKVKVFFPGGGDSRLVKVSKLRPSMIWSNGQWILWSREDNMYDMNEHELPNSKRLKIEAIQLVGVSNGTQITTQSNPKRITSSIKERGDLKLPPKGKEDQSRLPGFHAISGISKSSKQRKPIETIKHDGTRGAVESTNRRFQGVKAEVHKKAESCETTKSNVAQNVKVKSLSQSSKTVCQKDIFSREESNKSVNVKSTRMKSSLNQSQSKQVHSNLHTGGIPPTHNINMEGVKKRTPSASVQKNKDEYSRVGKQLGSSAVGKRKQLFSGRDPLQSVNEKKGNSQHLPKATEELYTHPVHESEKFEKGSCQSNEPAHLLKKTAMEQKVMESDESDHPYFNLCQQSLNQFVEKEKKPSIPVQINQKFPQHIEKTDTGMVEKEELETRELRRTCRIITPTSKLLEAIETASVVKSKNILHDRGSKPNSNDCTSSNRIL